MRKIIAGNWKMYGDRGMARPLAQAVAAAAGRFPGAQAVLCPPAVLLAEVRAALGDAKVALGGQDCSPHAEGAYTGDLSAPMLKEAGCSHVIVGHSERRLYHHECNDNVRLKAAAAMACGLIPIICIGENEEERASGKAEENVCQQLGLCLPDEARAGNFVLAYEPVWAIGSGKTPTAADIERMHAAIRAETTRKTGLAADAVAVLYGGSVKAANAAGIVTIAGVGGLLVGGASLKAEEFCEIIRIASDI